MSRPRFLWWQSLWSLNKSRRQRMHTESRGTVSRTPRNEKMWQVSSWGRTEVIKRRHYLHLGTSLRFSVGAAARSPKITSMPPFITTTEIPEKGSL